ncbi:MAG: aromatic-ring-hydroxylating dioxygenase subunit beta [Bdellovibrionota bacterium]
MKLSSLSDRDLRLEIESLLTDYAYVLDEGEIEKWPAFFTEQGLYKIVSRENFEKKLPLALWLSESRAMCEDRVTALRQASVYSPRVLRHLVTNVKILSHDGERVRAQSNFAILQTLLDGETHLFISGKYLDTIVSEGGKLVFEEKICVYDTLRIPNSVVWPV